MQNWKASCLWDIEPEWVFPALLAWLWAGFGASLTFPCSI